MSLTKRIGPIAEVVLSNAGHMNMDNEIYVRILDTTMAVLHLEAPALGYKECLDREAECMSRVTGNTSTVWMKVKDKGWNKILQFVHSMSGSYKIRPGETLRALALLAGNMLRAYNKIYAKAYTEGTTLIDDLLLNLAKAGVAEALKTLRPDTYITQLKSLNSIYRALDTTRTDKYVTRVKTDTTRTRKATDKTLDLITQRVNTYIMLEPTEVIDAFIDTVNQIFRRYKNLIAAKGGPTSPPKSDNRPYPMPDPTLSPESPSGDSGNPDEI